MDYGYARWWCQLGVSERLSETVVAEPMNRLTRRQLQSLVFLLVLPAVNWLFAVTTLYDLGVGTLAMAGRVAIRLWLVFGLSFLALIAIRKHLPAMLDQDHFWRLLGVHSVVILGVSAMIGSLFDRPAFMEQANSMLMPRIFLIMEIVVYVAVLWILRQQELNFATADRLREAQLNVLKSQSNPHFLFNTLNLITAEISTNPDSARETVFDLADLLRSNIKLAEQRLVKLSDELHLLSLYLRLQQRRFKERLNVSFEIDPRTENIQIPSLLLQPVVENTIKWAVAPYAGPASVEVATELRGDRFSIVIKDSGPAFDEDSIVEGDGFRILRRTLDLEYRDNYQLSLISTPEGGVLSLDLPLTTAGGRDG